MTKIYSFKVYLEEDFFPITSEVKKIMEAIFKASKLVRDIDVEEVRE